MKTKPSPGFITFAVVGLTVLIFILDLLTPLGIAEWLLYLIPLVLAGHALSTRRTWWLAGVCTALTVAGFFLSPPGVVNSLAVLNRTMGVGTFVATVWLVTRRQRAEAELRRTNRALRTISECNQLLVRATDEPTLLDGVCRLLVEHGGYRMCWVGFAEQDEAKNVRPVAQAGFESGYLDTVNVTWADTERGRGPTGTAIRTGQPVIARNIPTDPAYGPWRAAAIQRGYASSIALPLASGNEGCIGALMIYAAEPDMFDAAEVALLSELAGDLAYGLAALRTRAVWQEQQQFLAALFDNIGEAVVSCDAQGRLARFNRAARELHGLPEEPILPEEWAEHYALFEADGRTPLRKENIPLFRALLGETVRDAEMVVAPKHGAPRSLIASAQPLRDAAGRITGAVASMHDITARKQAEDALRQERIFADGVLNSLPGVLYCYDEQFRFCRWNESFERVTGYTHEEIARQGPLTYFAGEDKELLTARIREVFAKGASDVEADFMSKDGTRTPYYFTGVRAEIGGKPHLVGVGIDISARRAAEAALRESEARFRATFEQAAVGVARVAPDGAWLDVNQRLCDLVGYTRAELLARTFQDITHPDDLNADLGYVRQMLAGEIATYAMEKRYLHKDGHIVWIHLTVSLVREPSGAPKYFISVVEDITARKQAEHERQKFFMLAESSSEFIGMCDLDLQPLYVNPAGVRMVGLPDMAAACRVKVQDYFFPEDQRFIAEEFFPRVMREGHGDVEIRLRHFQTGAPIWMFYYLFSVRDAAGTPIGWATVSRDITGRMKAEAALRESEARLSFALEQSHTGGWDLDLTSHTAHRTLQHDQIFGYKTLLSQWTYELFLEHVLPEDRAEVDRRFQAAVAAQADWSFECRIRRVDGAVRWIWAAGGHQRDASGHARRMAGIVQDITQRKQLELALQENEERLRLALDAAHMGTFDWDVPANHIVWSRWHEELWGFKPGEFGGTYEAFASRVHPDDVPGINAEVARCIAAREPFTREFRVVWPGGSVRWIQATGEFTFDAHGQPARMRGVVIETSARKRAEEALHAVTHQLQEAQDEERRRIARDLHDSTAQKLAAATMNLGALEAVLPSTAAGSRKLFNDSLRLVEEAAQEIRTLSHVLHPPLLEELGLFGALRTFVEGFAQRSGLEVAFDAPDELPALSHETEVTLFRVAQEALGNVHRHSGSRTASVRLGCEAGRVTLEVRDQGRGAPLERFKGTAGVGLASMRARLQLLGGQLEVDSGAGGTALRATVPVGPAATVAAPAA